MFGQNQKRNPLKIETLVGQNTTLKGDIHFSGGLHIDGTIKGNVIADDGASSVLSLSEHGRIEGEVRVPVVTLNGTVNGNVFSSKSVELAPHARIKGDVYYNMIEMAMGAEVNGKLVHKSEAEVTRVTADVRPVEIKQEPKPGPTPVAAVAKKS